MFYKTKIVCGNTQYGLKMARWLVLFALVLLALVHDGSAITCFQCGEQKGGDGICRDDHGNKHATVDCASSCITHTMGSINVGGHETGDMIVRVCADPIYCTIGANLMEQKLGLKKLSCTSCNSNYCNSAATTIPSFILVAALAVKYYFL